MSWDRSRETCREFARILKGTGQVTSDGVCFVQRIRHLSISIEGIPTRSPLVLAALFSFEKRNGRILNLGETVLLQEEVNPFITELRKGNLTVTALHNHWLFDQPRTMYIHFQSTKDDPITFARKVARAFEVLKG